MHCLFSLKSLLKPKSDCNSGQKQPVPAHLTQSKTLQGPCCCGPQPSLPALLQCPPHPHPHLALFPPVSHASNRCVEFSSNRCSMFLPQEFCTCCFLCRGYLSSGEPCGCSLKTVTSGPEMHSQMHLHYLKKHTHQPPAPPCHSTLLDNSSWHSPYLKSSHHLTSLPPSLPPSLFPSCNHYLSPNRI